MRKKPTFTTTTTKKKKKSEQNKQKTKAIASRKSSALMKGGNSGHSYPRSRRQDLHQSRPHSPTCRHIRHSDGYRLESLDIKMA